MKNFILFITLLFAGNNYAQVSGFYGLARKSSPAEIYLATVNSSTGMVTNISTSPVGQSINLTGAALDPYNNYFHFITNNTLKSIDLNTGIEISAPVITNPVAASYFDNFRFNNSDSMLYGLARRNVLNPVTNTYTGEMYLATINTTSGIINQLSPSSVGQSFALVGSAIDPYQMVYYYSTGQQLIGLDMYNGAIYSTATINFPSGGTYFDNFAYSCADTTLYGLIRTNYFSWQIDTIVLPNLTYIDSTQVLDSAEIRLGKINPATGVVTTISPVPVNLGGYAVNAGATIDPNTMTYYYGTGYELVGISIATGLKVSQHVLSNPNGQYFDMMRISQDCYHAIPTRTATGIGTTKHQPGLILYPNPATDHLNIQYSENLLRTELSNLSGQVVLTSESNDKKIQLDISSLPKGIYLLKCFTAEKMITEKIIRQ